MIKPITKLLKNSIKHKSPFLLALAFIAFLALIAKAEDIEVIDGDSLMVNGEKIRLIGIDAPEYSQTCNRADGTKYACGKEAMTYMQQMINEGQQRGDKINCKNKGVDRYKRNLCICRMGAVNLNKEMVRAGWAIAYMHTWYNPQQEEAQNAQIGIWQGRFMRPELYRRLKKSQKTQK